MSALAGLTRELLARLEDVAEAERIAAGGIAPGAPPPAQLSEPLTSSSSVVPSLASLRSQVDACRLCPLGGQRLKPAFGVGPATAAVMFVGEGPGYEEDRKGEPFVGKAGQLLDRILAAIGLSRQTAYIANMVKCHPMKDPSRPESRGNDRAPTPEEIAACRAYLEEQIRLVGPRFIVALGGVAARALLRREAGVGALRGRWHEYRQPGAEARLLVTYHPAALLREPERKRDVWEDMKRLKAALEAA